MRKYNLALIPNNKSQQIALLSQQFIDLADSYMHGEHSFPHITLYQFEADDRAISEIINKVRQVWRFESVEFQFNTFSHFIYAELFWLSLLPDNLDILNEMHQLLASLIGRPVKANFDPHMTLINTRNQDYKKAIEQRIEGYIPIKDTFSLALGYCDGAGQVTKIIYRFTK